MIWNAFQMSFRMSFPTTIGFGSAGNSAQGSHLAVYQLNLLYECMYPLVMTNRLT